VSKTATKGCQPSAFFSIRKIEALPFFLRERNFFFQKKGEIFEEEKVKWALPEIFSFERKDGK